MINFLRKIRKSLIKTGSARKYFLYAIGEILLVMIGILLALQVNNWNEWRNERTIERDLLIQLLSDLEKTLADHNRDFSLQTGFLNSTWVILSYLENSDITYLDSMATHFVKSSMDDYSYPISKTYESLKASDSKIISNDSLGNLIHILYEDTYPRLEKSRGYTVDIEDLMRPYIKQHFTVNDLDLEEHRRFVESRIEISRPGGVIAKYNQIGYRPLDFHFIMNDPEYRFLLHQSVRLRGYKLAQIKKAILDTEEAMSLIQAELNN